MYPAPEVNTTLPGGDNETKSEDLPTEFNFFQTEGNVTDGVIDHYTNNTNITTTVTISAAELIRTTARGYYSLNAQGECNTVPTCLHNWQEMRFAIQSSEHLFKSLTNNSLDDDIYADGEGEETAPSTEVDPLNGMCNTCALTPLVGPDEVYAQLPGTPECYVGGTASITNCHTCVCKEGFTGPLCNLHAIYTRFNLGTTMFNHSDITWVEDESVVDPPTNTTETNTTDIMPPPDNNNNTADTLSWEFSELINTIDTNTTTTPANTTTNVTIIPPPTLTADDYFYDQLEHMLFENQLLLEIASSFERPHVMFPLMKIHAINYTYHYVIIETRSGIDFFEENQIYQLKLQEEEANQNATRPDGDSNNSTLPAPFQLLQTAPSTTNPAMANNVEDLYQQWLAMQQNYAQTPAANGQASSFTGGMGAVNQLYDPSCAQYYGNSPACKSTPGMFGEVKPAAVVPPVDPANPGDDNDNDNTPKL